MMSIQFYGKINTLDAINREHAAKAIKQESKSN